MARKNIFVQIIKNGLKCFSGRINSCSLRGLSEKLLRSNVKNEFLFFCCEVSRVSSIIAIIVEIFYAMAKCRIVKFTQFEMRCWMLKKQLFWLFCVYLLLLGNQIHLRNLRDYQHFCAIYLIWYETFLREDGKVFTKQQPIFAKLFSFSNNIAISVIVTVTVFTIIFYNIWMINKW